MKKVLLAGTALLGVAALAAPAHAELDLNLGGYYSGYVVNTDNDEPAGADSLRELDFRRDTEVHVSGETTLDNGLTVGFHTEQALGGETTTDEAYAYFSGGWGRVNFGSEDGAAYLLQVAAPSADSNIDGLRTYIQALQPVITPGTLPVAAGSSPVLGVTGGGLLDYDHVSDPSNSGTYNTDRLSYLTPKFSGFQAGVSYAPEQGQNGIGDAVSAAHTDNDPGQYEDIWEAGVRWDGEFSGFGISVGGGYSNADLEEDVAAGAAEQAAAGQTDGVDAWNAGLTVTFSGFSLGGSYLRANTENTDAVDTDNNNGTAAVLDSLDVTQDTWVVGGAWDNGPYHVGASYLHQNTQRDASNAGAAGDATSEVAAVDYDADRATVGAGYTFGPGMTFRGSVAWGEFDGGTAATSNDFTQIAVGTEIDF